MISAKQNKERVISFRVTGEVAAYLASKLPSHTDQKQSVNKLARSMFLASLPPNLRNALFAGSTSADVPEFDVIHGDARDCLPSIRSESVDICVTSPPYFRQRDYGHACQIGQERTLDEYIRNVVETFKQVKRILKPTGTLWIVIDDSYLKKRLLGVPWRLALALQEQGWLLRAEMIWAKNSLPEPVTDRPTRSHETMFLFSKQPTYFYDADAIREPHTNPWSIDCIQKAKELGLVGRPRTNPFKKEVRHKNRQHGITRAEYGALMNERGVNKRSVWRVNTEKFRGEHSAVFPEALIEPCILAGCPANGFVLDPFAGMATTGVVALKHGRKFLGIELVESYAVEARKRLQSVRSSSPRPD